MLKLGKTVLEWGVMLAVVLGLSTVLSVSVRRIDRYVDGQKPSSVSATENAALCGKPAAGVGHDAQDEVGRPPTPAQLAELEGRPVTVKELEDLNAQWLAYTSKRRGRGPTAKQLSELNALSPPTSP